MWLNRQGKKTVATNAEAVAQVEKTDGRKQRSVRSRDKIKSSIITLIRDGNYSPRAIDISEHSGLSMRTVFRHIDDMESLLRDRFCICCHCLFSLSLQPHCMPPPAP